MNIPVTLINYALSNKIVNQFKVYIYLKSICSGHFRVHGDFVSNACLDLDIQDRRTFSKNLRWLLNNRWVTLNSKTGSYRIVSYDRLCYRLKIKGFTNVAFCRDYFKSFRPFLYAASMTTQVRIKNRSIRQPVWKEGRTRKSMSTGEKLEKIDTLPVRYMGKVLDLDYSTISLYKKAACEVGYISCHHHYEDTGIPGYMIRAFMKDNPDEAGKHIVHNGRIHIQRPDKFRNHEIVLKRRRIRTP